MLHVGVSNVAEKFTVETQAHRKGYQRFDYFNKCPSNHTCSADGAMRIQTKLNVEQICKEFNDGNPVEKTSAVSSKDAGRYESYIYLLVGKERDANICVPYILVALFLC